MFPLSKKLPSENNKIYSYRAIKEGILSLQLQPGQALSVVDLAKVLKVSTTPIKEAMGRLQREQLVEVIPQVGTYVSKIKPQLIEEAASIWLILEKEALRLACKSFPRENLDQLKKNLALQEMWLVEKGTEWDFKKLDENFHYIIFQGNQRKMMWEVIAQLAAHYHRMTMLSQREDHFYDLITNHKNIISIIENKEIDQVEDIVEKHILEPIEGWRNLYHQKSAYTSYFDFTEKSGILASIV